MPIMMLQIGAESNGVNSIFANKGNREKLLGHLFIISSSSDLFNKADFEQYLFKLEPCLNPNREARSDLQL